MRMPLIICAAVALVVLGWFGREAVGFSETPKEERSPDPPAVAVALVTNAMPMTSSRRMEERVISPCLTPCAQSTVMRQRRSTSWYSEVRPSVPAGYGR